MNTPRLPLALLLALSGLVNLPAQTKEDQQDNPAAAERPTRPAPRQVAPRAISSTLAQTLAASMPDYNPPAPPEPKSEEEQAADRPRNRIIRLPKVVVEGVRSPVFTEREVYTSRGLAELAMNRYLSELDRGILNRFTLPLFGSSNEARAMEEYRAQERLRHMAETDARVAALRTTDPAAADQLQEVAYETFIHKPAYVVPTSLARD